MIKTFLSQLRVIHYFDAKARYRGSYFGFIWVFAYPIMMYLAQGFAVSHFKGEVEGQYLIYLLLGAMPWYLFSQTVTMSVGTLVRLTETLKNSTINPWLYIISTLLDNFIIFFLCFFMLLGGIHFILDDVFSHISFWKFFLSIIPFLIFTFSVSSILAILNVFIRDIGFLMSFLLQTFYFLTPILYFPSDENKYLGIFYKVNLLYQSLRPIQLSMLNQSTSDFFSALIISFTLSIIALISTSILWKKAKTEVFHAL